MAGSSKHGESKKRHTRPSVTSIRSFPAEGNRCLAPFWRPQFLIYSSSELNLTTRMSWACLRGGQVPAGSDVDRHGRLCTIRVRNPHRPWFLEGRPWFVARRAIITNG